MTIRFEVGFDLVGLAASYNVVTSPSALGSVHHPFSPAVVDKLVVA